MNEATFSEWKKKEEWSRCHCHTSHVAVVDLPPLSSVLHLPLSSLSPSLQFLPPCQDVSGVSRYSVKTSHCSVFPPQPFFFFYLLHSSLSFLLTLFCILKKTHLNRKKINNCPPTHNYTASKIDCSIM